MFMCMLTENHQQTTNLIAYILYHCFTLGNRGETSLETIKVRTMLKIKWKYIYKELDTFLESVYQITN